MNNESVTHDASIRLHGVRSHNLRGFDLDLPLGQLIAITGVSGSGKTSLAFDVLHAEGQRRYIETFPAFVRQFLPRLEKPNVDAIDNVPPAIGVSQRAAPGKRRLVEAAGLASLIEALFARASTITCPTCGRHIERATPEGIAEELAGLAPDARITIGFPVVRSDDESWLDTTESLREAGYVRLAIGDTIERLDQATITEPAPETPARILIDRLRARDLNENNRLLRTIESLESAMHESDGTVAIDVDGKWSERSERLRCPDCAIDFPPPMPSLFSLDNDESHCDACGGGGHEMAIDIDRVIPDPTRTLRQRGVAPFCSIDDPEAWSKFLITAKESGLPIDLPLGEFDDSQRRLLVEGVADRGFAGVVAAANELDERRGRRPKSKLADQLLAPKPCRRCRGHCFRPEVLAYRLEGWSIGDVLTRELGELNEHLSKAYQPPQAASSLVGQILRRLDYFCRVGLDYLPLARDCETLSTGEARRVALSSVLASGMSRLLCVLDEPSAGLDPTHTEALVACLKELRDQGNTLLVVEHDQQVIESADHLVDLGPGAAKRGGRILYQGSPHELGDSEGGPTSDYWLQPVDLNASPRPPRGQVRLEGCRTHHLRDLSVAFPLGGLCVVIGPSGSGKSSLVIDTLAPALLEKLEGSPREGAMFRRLHGAERIDEVIVSDARPVGRTSRSNPATLMKIFDEIRKLFAQTLDARTQGMGASDFSFNVAGGRCERCEGTGTLTVDMQFLPDVHLPCPECGGTRFQQHVLNVKYRGRNIAEVLELTASDAFGFFREQPKIQERLSLLRQVGLDYLTLGQSATTLSGGEWQRIKLASHLSLSAGKHRLFLFDEPALGLHPADVSTLLQCFDSLLDAGHSIIAIDNGLRLAASADYLIELGPGGGRHGGQVVGEGAPELVASRSTPMGLVLHRRAQVS
ncbi:UvrABC system protein A [Planctomycetes bacterium Pan216]|uniref:UvrABC system protein A n=1 Tax=Kolteria novifilia TaxID=2527975 RepID=A0A518B0V5_9BACT|nr:UvrABC system protein A [Planctomycetes bacterium Pan216]